MMTLKEFGEKLKGLNQAYSALKRKYKKPKTGEIIEVAGMKWCLMLSIWLLLGERKIDRGKCI